jgi:hypothetical protein
MEVLIQISEKAQAVCDLIPLGRSVLSACKEVEWSHDSFFKELKKSPALADEYARARAARADARFESVDQIKDELREGKIDHHQARVIIDAIKWQAGKEKPKVYGDKSTIEHTGGDKPIKFIPTTPEEAQRAYAEEMKQI